MYNKAELLRNFTYPFRRNQLASLSSESMQQFAYFKSLLNWPCKNVWYNDVNNQQDETTFSFINLFNSALHVSGDKFAHPQEHFLTVHTVKKYS